MPPIQSKPRQSARLNREPIDEENGLSFPLEAFKNSEVPRNREVLERLFHVLTEGVGQRRLEDASRMVVLEILARWRGSNILIAHEQTLIKRVMGLHSLYTYVLLIQDLNGGLIDLFTHSFIV